MSPDSYIGTKYFDKEKKFPYLTREKGWYLEYVEISGTGNPHTMIGVVKSVPLEVSSTNSSEEAILSAVRKKSEIMSKLREGYEVERFLLVWIETQI